MTPLSVRFRYYTGLTRSPFSAAALFGSWTADGLASRDAWGSWPMSPFAGEDGCPGFGAELTLDPAGVGTTFAWGVLLTRADGSTVWGVAAEVPEPDRTAQELRFTLRPAGPVMQEETHHLSHHRWYGAHPWSEAGFAPGRLRFAVWAPNAADCQVIFGGASGYIADDGYGADATVPALPMTRHPDGVWEAVIAATATVSSVGATCTWSPATTASPSGARTCTPGSSAVAATSIRKASTTTARSPRSTERPAAPW